MRRKSTWAAPPSGPPSRRGTMISGEGSRSRKGTFIEATAKYYAPQTKHLSTAHLHRNFARMLKSDGADAPRVAVDHEELRRFSLVQVKPMLILCLRFSTCFLISLGASRI